MATHFEATRIAELKRAELDIHRELERLQTEKQSRHAEAHLQDQPLIREEVRAGRAYAEGGDQPSQESEIPSPEVVLDLVWKLPFPAAGRRPLSKTHAAGEAYRARVFKAGSSAEKMARLEVRILGEQAAALGTLEAEARYRESVAHAAWTEKAACIQAVGAELDAHEQAARMANDATQRKQRAFQEARKRFEQEMAAAFKERDSIIQQAKEKVRLWKAEAHVRAAHPEPSRPSRPSTDLKWKGTTRPERATPEVTTNREVSRGFPEGAERERESPQREKGRISRRAEGAREIGRGAGEETWAYKKEDQLPRDAKRDSFEATPKEPAPFDEPADRETEGPLLRRPRVAPTPGEEAPEQSPGVLAAVAGAGAAAAAAAYEMTADVVSAPVKMVEQLVSSPVRVVEEVVTAPVNLVDELLVTPLIGRAGGEEIAGKGREASGVKAQVEEFEQAAERTKDRPSAAVGGPRKPSPTFGESSPEAWEVIEKDAAGGRSSVAAPPSRQEGEPEFGLESRGRQRTPSSGASQERSPISQTFSWGREEEAAEEAAQRGRQEGRHQKQAAEKEPGYPVEMEQ